MERVKKADSWGLAGWHDAEWRKSRMDALLSKMRAGLWTLGGLAGKMPICNKSREGCPHEEGCALVLGNLADTSGMLKFCMLDVLAGCRAREC